MTLELNAGGSLPTNDPGILKDTKTQLKLKLSTATAAANNVIQLSQTGSGGCTYCATLGGTYQATLAIAFGSGEDTKTAIYVQCATAHATGSQLVATKTAGDDAYDTLTTPAMAVATTLSGSTSDITVTKHNDAALPTDDPGILKDFETQLKITLTTASVGTTTVSMSMSNTNGGCQFSTTSGGTYATTKNVAISNGVDVTTGIYVKCATGHATGGSIIATVSVTSVNSYNTLTHTAMAVATTLSGSVTVKQSNNNALATNAPGVHKDVYHPLKVDLVGGVSTGTTTVTLSRNGANGNCRFAASDGGGLATSLSVTFSNGVSMSTAAWVCDADHATGVIISGTQASSSHVNRYTSAFAAGTTMAVFSTTFAPTTVPKRSSGTTTVTITLSSGTWSSTTDRIKIVGTPDANCAGTTICGHAVVSGGSAGPPGARTVGFTCATAVKDGKICYSNDAGTR